MFTTSHVQASCTYVASVAQSSVLYRLVNQHPWVQANVFNLQQKKVIRDLNPEDIEQLVSVSGMVTRCSNIIPEIRCASLSTWQGNRPCD